MRRWFTILSGLAIASLALFVRGECLRDELWIDEYLTGWTVTDSWNEAHIRARLSHQSLPYTWLMWGVTRVAGLSPVSLRAASLVAGLAVVLGCAVWTERLTGSCALGLLAGFCAAVDPNFIFYASEARSYALVQLFGLIGCWAWCAWHLPVARQVGPERPRRVPLVWVAASLTMFYMHYTSAVLLAAQWAIGWLLLARKSRAAIRSWALGSGIVAALMIPGLIDLASLYKDASDWSTFSSVAQLWRAVQPDVWTLVVPGLVFSMCLLISQSEDRRRVGRHLACLAAAYLSMMGVLLLMSGWGIAPLGHYRYAIAAAGLPVVLGASSLIAVPDWWSRAALAGILGLFALSGTGLGESLARGYVQPPLRFERWSDLVATIDKSAAGESFPVVMFPNLIEDYRLGDPRVVPRPSYFSAPLTVIHHLEQRRAIVARPTWRKPRFDAMTLREIRTAGGVWLVIRGGPMRATAATDLAGAVVAELSDLLGSTSDRWRFEDHTPTQSDVSLIRVTMVLRGTSESSKID